MKECQITQIRSQTETGIVVKGLGDFIVEQLERLGRKAEFVLYTHNEVVIGKVLDKQLFPQKDFGEIYFKEIRIFNKKAELHIWRYNGNFNYRIRIDGESELENIYEEEHIVWGTDIEEKENGALLKEERGTNIEIPYKIKKEDLPIKYKVRNYFTYDENGLIKFYDARLVEFVNKEGEALGE